jgi:hypothetical protein
MVLIENGRNLNKYSNSTPAVLHFPGDKAAADAAEKALAASIAADKMVSDHLAAKNAKAAKELEDARVAQVAADKAAYIKANEASSNPKSSGGFNVIPVLLLERLLALLGRL